MLVSPPPPQAPGLQAAGISLEAQAAIVGTHGREDRSLGVGFKCSPVANQHSVHPGFKHGCSEVGPGLEWEPEGDLGLTFVKSSDFDFLTLRANEVRRLPW